MMRVRQAVNSPAFWSKIMSKPTLVSPDRLSRWATDGGTTLEPSEGLKNTGWADDDRPPGRKWNWVWNNTYEWFRRLAGMSVTNFAEIAVTGPTNLETMVYQKQTSLWLSAESGAGDAFVSKDGGISWTNVRTLTSTILNNRCSAANGGQLLIAFSNGSIDYSDDGLGGGWLNDAAPAMSAIITIATKAESAFTMIGGPNGAIEFASGGAGSVWSTPTTGIGGSESVRTIASLGGTTWAAMVGTTVNRLYISTDDGANWAASAADPATNFSGSFLVLAFSESSGRLVLLGNTATSAAIEYTDDLGATWNAASILDKPGGAATGDAVGDIYHLGAGIWVAAGDFNSPGNLSPIVSVDDGAKWSAASALTALTNTQTYAIGCDGKKLLIAAGSKILTSLAIPGSLNE